MSDLKKLFAPKSIAVVGASNDLGKIRGRVLAVLKGAGFDGPIYPVNPSADEIQGLKAYPSIGAVPEPVDLAVIALSAAQVLQTLEDCAAAGVGSAIVFASGFADAGDLDAQKKISELAERTGMRILGPNTVGYYNEPLGIAPSFSPIMTERIKHRTGKEDLSSGIDIVCQSGGLGFALYSRALAAGITVRNAITTGNEADCEALEIVDYLIEQGGSRAILLFIEGFSRPDRLAAVAEKAAANNVPLLIAKMGRSDAGQRAAVSHTAHLTGSDVICEAVFSRYGVLRVADPEEMLAQAAVLARLPQAKGKKVAIITTSGGTGGWAADILSGEGLSVPEPTPELRARLDALIPGFGSSANPVDVTANVVEDGGIGLAKVIDEVSTSGEFDAALVILSLAAPGRIKTMRPILEPILQRRSMPIIFHSPGIPTQDNVDLLAEIGAIQLSLREAGVAITSLARHGENQAEYARQAAQPVAAPKPLPAGINALDVLPDASGKPADRRRVRATLDAYGVTTPPEAIVASEEEAARIAAEIGFPVAMKIESADVPHKTDAGCVVLGVSDAAGSAEAFRTIVANAKRYDADARIDGVLIQKMMPPGTEMVVGMTRDPDFGPMIMLGMGGIYVEVLRDSVVMPAPLRPEDAHKMIERLKGAQILKGVRGLPPADVDALAGILLGLSRLAVDAGEALAEVDLNPVIVYPKGQGASAVDYLFVPGDAAQATGHAAQAA